MSIADRISSLNLGHVGRYPNPITPQVSRPEQPASNSARPPPPVLPPRSRSTGNQSLQHGELSEKPQKSPTIGNLPNYQLPRLTPPPPPPRPQQSPSPAPPPPPRRPSELSLVRKDSNESIASTLSVSSVSTYGTSRGTSITSATRTPSWENRNGSRRPSFDNRTLCVPVYDAATLPPLPPKRPQNPQLETPKPGLVSQQSTPSNSLSSRKPSVPDKLPTLATQNGFLNDVSISVEILENKTIPIRPRPLTKTGTTSSNLATQGGFSNSKTAKEEIVQDQVVPEKPKSSANSTAPRPTPQKRSALDFGMNKPEKTPQKPTTTPSVDTVPPPIPLSSRPNLVQLQASKPIVFTPSNHPTALSSAVTPSSTTNCLRCRDFSAPDAHAARFSRTAIPSTDLAWLSHQLTNPFPSSTDKARAIFTWLHHNIAYNTADFFSGNLKPSTPASTIATGLAVCEGYAGLFTALALHANLESIVVSGHGKGYGHHSLLPGEQIPPYTMNHAWSAVKLDDGAWKLLDPCWGAGHLNASKTYTASFTPGWFTADNATFGYRHFPTDRAHLFLADDRHVTWEQYIVGLEDGAGPGEDVQVAGTAETEHALAPESFMPRKRRVELNGHAGDVVRFGFAKVCPHWEARRRGREKPYAFVLAGEGGKLLPFQTDGYRCWVDVPVRDLRPGSTLTCAAITSVGGKDARGLEAKEVVRRGAREGWASSGIASWVVAG